MRGSLRRMLIVGATLWSIGVFCLSGVVMMHLVLTNPEVPRFFHHIFAQVIAMLAIAAVCISGGVFFMRRGLSPISNLRERLADVHHGRERHMRGEYPSEVEPLIADLNALLDARDASVARAQAKAGDLAHGLKTPLAVLNHEAEQVRAAGHEALAATISAEIQRMQKQIDYHLAQARAAASGATSGARTEVALSVDGLVRTMKRVYADRPLIWSSSVDPAHVAKVERQDLDEMLGNLLDNASKWARSSVRISSELTASGIRVTVDDDGPGLAKDLRESVLARGVRADEGAPGSGLGLAIVRDLAGVYGGSVALSDSSLGGLRAGLTLPAAATSAHNEE
jgi:signal transduction histidine kinase